MGQHFKCWLHGWRALAAVAEDYPTVNVAVEHENPTSMLTLYHRLIALRRAEPALEESCYPLGFYHQVPPGTASIVWGLEYAWGDEAWMKERHQCNALSAPTAIYEVHLGSWMRMPEEDNCFLTYRELAPHLADYVQQMGFTHVELLPVTEHPFYGS